MDELYKLPDDQQKGWLLNLSRSLRTTQILLLLFPLFCFAQKWDYYEKYTALNKLPQTDFEAAVNDSIVRLSPGNLFQFLIVLQEKYNANLTAFCSTLTDRLATYETSLDIYNLSAILLDEEGIEKNRLENIINEKKEIWDKGEWSKAFWELIRANGLKVEEGPFYLVNEKGEKRYDLESFLKHRVDTNEIGKNPLIMLDYQIVSYSENALLETLEKLKIRDIIVISKKEGSGLYGIRGADGLLSILTEK